MNFIIFFGCHMGIALKSVAKGYDIGSYSTWRIEARRDAKAVNLLYIVGPLTKTCHPQSDGDSTTITNYYVMCQLYYDLDSSYYFSPCQQYVRCLTTVQKIQSVALVMA